MARAMSALNSGILVANIAISEKTPVVIKTEVLGAGIVISAKGLRADDTVEVACEMRMDIPVRGAKPAWNHAGRAHCIHI